MDQGEDAGALFYTISVPLQQTLRRAAKTGHNLFSTI